MGREVQKVCVCVIRRERERDVNGCCSDVSVFSQQHSMSLLLQGHVQVPSAEGANPSDTSQEEDAAVTFDA